MYGVTVFAGGPLQQLSPPIISVRVTLFGVCRGAVAHPWRAAALIGWSHSVATYPRRSRGEDNRRRFLCGGNPSELALSSLRNNGAAAGADKEIIYPLNYYNRTLCNPFYLLDILFKFGFGGKKPAQ